MKDNPLDEWLDRLLEHESAYTGFAAACEKTPGAWYLSAPGLPAYQDANRALRLRDDGRGPEALAGEVMSYFRTQGLPPVVDLDPVSEQQGIGAALRRLGMMPVAGDRVLMCYSGALSQAGPPRDISIHSIHNETGRGEAAEWIETAVSDDSGQPDEPLWHAVAELEARYTPCKLYLAYLQGRPAGTCDLFSHNGWGRIDSVVTRPEFRRRGVASALVSRAVADSVTTGNACTYLFTEASSDAERLYLKLGFERTYRNVLRRHLV